jgi:hypothetical protein
VPIFVPSPQIVAQTLGVPVQAKPLSIAQIEEHPSPFVVLLLP